MSDAVKRSNDQLLEDTEKVEEDDEWVGPKPDEATLLPPKKKKIKGLYVCFGSASSELTRSFNV